jgi:hypothetical protein
MMPFISAELAVGVGDGDGDGGSVGAIVGPRLAGGLEADDELVACPPHAAHNTMNVAIATGLPTRPLAPRALR